MATMVEIFFLDLLAELSGRFNLEIYAYVLMGNQYHLLLKTKDANLSKAMQWFGTTYTRKFNLKNQTSGHLFQGRFKSIIVGNDAYLLRLLCYIHRNPLRAGIVERLAGYRWSSYLNYAYRKKPPEWLRTETILNQVSCENPHKAYRIKVQNYSDEKICPDDKDKRDLMIYLLWRAGRLSNSAIGAYFGLTYSAVSRSVKIISDKLREIKTLEENIKL